MAASDSLNQTDALVARLSVAASDSLNQTDALVALLTVEALLFAALAIVVSLAASAPVARRLGVQVSTLGFIGAFAVLIVALGAFAAWWAVFASPWVWHTTALAESVGLLVGIVTPPAFAFVTAYGLMPEET